ncbi:MAG TPA: hypothetical protein VJU79_01580 [Candidatus Dormibacteraeota bacterium]|nr:hypothetical protein [Candidatus Dormibacteraeota bacterium]
MPSTLHPGAALDLSRACGLNLSAYRAEHVTERVNRALEQLLGRSERLSNPRMFGLEPVGPHAYRRVA